MTEDGLMYFNGIDAGSGTYAMPPIAPEDFTDLIQGLPLDEESARQMENFNQKRSTKHYGLKEDLDPKQLDQAGWGIIFPQESDPAVEEALRPLIDWRREQVGQSADRLHRVFRGADGFRPNDDKEKWLGRYGAQSGPVDPIKVPYYLLMVGSPQQIPFSFQNQIDVQYAVGRACFDTPDEYAAYAASVVEAEKRGLALARRAAFFGTAHPHDPSTLASADEMVRKLYDLFCADAKAAAGGWQFELALKEGATREQLASWLGGPQTPALLYTAGHGLAFASGHPRQRDEQGALLCQDFPGPALWSKKPIPREHYLCAEDLESAGSLQGLVAFFFACFGAGTPLHDEFAGRAIRSFGAPAGSSLAADRDPTEIAPAPFVARLPQRMLSHRRGGALAVIGHVERTWASSFMGGRAGPQLTVFESTLKRLLGGHPVGSAFEYFNMRYAELTANLFAEMLLIEAGKLPKPLELATLWTTSNDARNYVVLGDPAVRLMVAPADAPAAPGRERIDLSTGTAAGAQPAAAQPAAEAQPAETVKPAAPAAAPPAAQPVELQGEFSSSPATQRVSTWLCDDLRPLALLNAEPDAALLQSARLCALTYLKPDGEIVTLLAGPQPLDAALLSLHGEIVQQALRGRGPAQ